MRRAGACPRRPREFTAPPTKFHRPKAFPLGGRWLAAGETAHQVPPLPLALPRGELAKIFDFRLRGAAYRRCQCEPVTLAIDHHLRESPGSLQRCGRMRTGYVCVGRGHAPADHVSLPLHPPSSTAPKPSPSGEGGTATAVTDEGRNVKATASAKNPTFPPLISQNQRFLPASPEGEA